MAVNQRPLLQWGPTLLYALWKQRFRRLSLPRLRRHCLPHVHRMLSGGSISREPLPALRAAPAPLGIPQSLTGWVLSQLTVARAMGRFIGPLGNFSHNWRSFFVLE